MTKKAPEALPIPVDDKYKNQWEEVVSLLTLQARVLADEPDVRITEVRITLANSHEGVLLGMIARSMCDICPFSGKSCTGLKLKKGETDERIYAARIRALLLSDKGHSIIYDSVTQHFEGNGISECVASEPK